MIEDILVESSPIYPLWAFIMLSLSLILVDRKSYKYLLAHGILGAIITGVILLIFMELINAWQYVEAEPYIILGIPVFIGVAWFATIIIFLWALPREESHWISYVYIALYAFSGAGIDNFFHNLGLRSYADWYGAWIWFFVLYFNFWINYKIYLFRKDKI